MHQNAIGAALASLIAAQVQASCLDRGAKSLGAQIAQRWLHRGWSAVVPGDKATRARRVNRPSTSNAGGCADTRERHRQDSDHEGAVELVDAHPAACRAVVWAESWGGPWLDRCWVFRGVDLLTGAETCDFHAAQRSIGGAGDHASSAPTFYTTRRGAASSPIARDGQQQRGGRTARRRSRRARLVRAAGGADTLVARWKSYPL